MLARLKQASRCCVALVWAMVTVFALAPGISMAFAAPAGAYARIFVHAHGHDEDAHIHYGHHHHGHSHDGHDDHHHHDQAVGDGGQDDQGHPRVHVHCEVCCPGLLVPQLTGGMLAYRVSDRVAIQPVESMQGNPPDRLLRPPIPLFLL